MVTRSRIGAALVLGASLLACGPKNATPPDDQSDAPGRLAEDGAEAAAAETDSEILTSTLISTTTAGPVSLASAADLAGGELSTNELGDGARALFLPRGCLTVTHDSASRTVTYVFAGCIGPNGLRRIRGEVKATYTVAPDALALELVATDLQVNGATLDWTARAKIVADGVARTMTWSGQISGVTARGREVSRTNDKRVDWRVGERCIGVSGASEGRIGRRGVRTEIVDYRRCQGGCPEAGGRITLTNIDGGMSVSIAFDGTNRATYTGPQGETASIPLACTAP